MRQHRVLKSLSHFQPNELVKGYQVIKLLEEEFPVQHLCEVLQVSRSAYYDWKTGNSYQMSTSKQVLSQQVKDEFNTHKRRYGSRRLLVELQAKGLSIGRYQIRSIMQQQGLTAIQPKSFIPRTTDSRHGQRICLNLLLAEPHPKAPNKIWVSDMDLRQSLHLGPPIYLWWPVSGYT